MLVDVYVYSTCNLRLDGQSIVNLLLGQSSYRGQQIFEWLSELRKSGESTIECTHFFVISHLISCPWWCSTHFNVFHGRIRICGISIVYFK